MEEAERRSDRLWRLQEEAEESGRANTAVELRWTGLETYNLPTELHKEIQQQKASCRAIILSKDSLIREFMAELKAKDEEYVKTLQQQKEEIDELLARMDAQYRDLSEGYEAELASIEDGFRRERQRLMASQRNEMGGLFKQYQQAEQQYTEERLHAEKQYADDLDRLQSNDAEEYARLKIRLETDVQTLEQQLAVMRAMYMLNTEKLDYNYRVLIERDADNEKSAAQQKEKVKKLEAALTRVREEYRRADQRHRQRNTQLTAEYQRITKQYKELQTKAGHFAATDAAKFR